MAREKDGINVALNELAQGDIENPYIAGTNAFLKSIGWTDEDVTDAVNLHGKMEVKHAAMIGYDLIRKKSLPRDAVDGLPKLVATYGAEIVRQLALVDGIAPERISEEYAVHRVNGVIVVAPFIPGQNLEAVLLRPVSPNGKPQRNTPTSAVLIQYVSAK
ncbi:hypothetical protein HYU09_00080 [Candidatus Woesearchaeota archaeon]|nr:hypothetical protein [Candidatus Woesearchaeota archaeon]